MMNNNQRESRLMIPSLLACTLALFVAGCGQPCGTPKPYVVHGPLHVYYQVQRSATEADGSGAAQPMGDIQLFDQFVILTDKDGKQSQLIPMCKLRALTWTKD